MFSEFIGVFLERNMQNSKKVNFYKGGHQISTEKQPWTKKTTCRIKKTSVEREIGRGGILKDLALKKSDVVEFLKIWC